MASAGAKGRGHKRPVSVNENSPVIKAFRGYQTELDTKHDRHERIVKLSRDITIESKRVIFLLQRCAGIVIKKILLKMLEQNKTPEKRDDSEGRQAILQQALTKLKEIQHTKFLQLAMELEGQDPFQFIRAYSPGLQEYVEAVSFYYYLKDGMLVTLSQVEKDLKFSRSSATEIAQQKPSTDLKNPATVLSSTSESCTSSVRAPSSDKSPTGGSILVDSAAEVSSSSDGVMKVDSKEPADRHADGTISVTVPPMEFMLGIADLTGELMRTAIMSVSAGNLDYPVQICDFMRIIHDSFMSYGNTARELTRKMATLRQSLQKVENACYTLKVRGSEIPKHMLADIFTATSSDGPFAEDMEGSGFD